MSRLIPWRRVRIASWVALAGLLLAHPVARAASDVFSNVGPGSSTTGLADRFPLGNYALDHHFDAVSASLTGGIDVSGVPPLIAYFLADVIWQLTAFIANAVITLFTFAFSLDLVNGSQATGGAGALAPVSNAVRSIYSSVFGAPWMVLAVTAAGLWAMWKALVQRRYAETAGALGLSLLFTVVALAFVTQPERTIGQASRWTNELSAAFLSLSNSGTLSNETQARQQASDQLYTLLVYQPWAVLNFGGLEHCVKTPLKDPPQSVPVRPLSRNTGRDAQLSGQLRDGTQVQADGKACVNDANKYAAHFLAYPPESDDRNAEYDALKNGDSSKLPDSDPAKKNGGYPLSGVDKPAADAMGKGGQYQRLLLAVVILIGELGAWLLLGALSIGVILAQVLVLLLLAFAPVALVAGIYPGRGHDLFRGWLARLATFLVRKAIYSLILAVLLAVVAALQDATSNLGWLLSFGLQALFLWAVFLYRHQLTAVATSATTGPAGGRAQGVSLPSLYWASRLSRVLPGRSSQSRPGPATSPAPAPTSAGAQPSTAQSEGHRSVAPVEPSPSEQPPGDPPSGRAGEEAASDAPSASRPATAPAQAPGPTESASAGAAATHVPSIQRRSAARTEALDARPPVGDTTAAVERPRADAGPVPPAAVAAPHPATGAPPAPAGQADAAGVQAPNREAPDRSRATGSSPSHASLLEQLRADRERLRAGNDSSGEQAGRATEPTPEPIRPPSRPSSPRRAPRGSE